ncbi:MAG: redoxin domain-containing protein [Anaerolineae bacterium]|nr:redoxin domain-containing protein [Anaerolineae bacterium]
MLAEVGMLTLGLALATALYAAVAAFLFARRSDLRWGESARNGVLATAGLLGLSLLLLLAAFLTDHFEIRYVANHSSRALPPYLKASALWAGQEGSLLLWSFLQALFAVLALISAPGLSGHPLPRSRPTGADEGSRGVGVRLSILALITAFFTGVTLFLSNPFIRTAIVPADGLGLNPLLRHPGMIFHPPALLTGYVGMAVPFAYAMAALITGEVDGWTRAARRWTLVAWLFLGLGLLLGARWAYDVLGWGGYWGWDPVENAGLMPWLTATALLHGAAMEEERRGFRFWNFLLVSLTYALVLFGTFATRSGMIQSVHAFARSNLGPYFLAAIGLTLLGSLSLIYYRRHLLMEKRPSESLLSREGLFTLTLMLFVVLTGSILVGSLLPTLTEALTGRRFEATPDWFDRVTGPQFAVLTLLLALCPIAGRQRLEARRVIPALVGGVAVAGLAALSGFTRPLSLLGFALTGMAGGTVLTEIVRDVLARSRREGEGFLMALTVLVDRNRRKYGGYVVHLGIALLLIGVIGTRMYPLERNLSLAAGESAHLGRYTLVFEELRQDFPLSDRLPTWAVLSVYRNGAYWVTLQPRLEQYANFDQTVTIPALRAGLREDLYVVLTGWSADGSLATFKVFINPLASFLWLGGLVFLAGGAVAFWPSSAGLRLTVPQARRRALWNTIGLLAGTAVLLAAGVAMWGPGHGATSRPSGRPLPGQAAPDFTLTLLDGSTLSLSGKRGQVVVLNFWASWCPPCEAETPELQAVWEEYQGKGVAFIGIAYKDEEAAVRDFLSKHSITYPIGLDPAGQIADLYGITGVPETFVVDAEGKVVRFYIGPVTADQLRAVLEGLVR